MTLAVVLWFMVYFGVVFDWLFACWLLEFCDWLIAVVYGSYRIWAGLGGEFRVVWFRWWLVWFGDCGC